ncbi:MAG: 16S rRNA (cytidine(1402)-2'-O)-methyltransferase [Candidatus Gastranaerophilales bacterium]|nr:16S rRNA (cytidine(1402)-2'-O)-methyltransferase [Candidatus Gastranaerophilales bacterium]
MDYQFFIVATPIGNLEDISLRALQILKQADYIACEDTRITKILSNKYDINAKLFDCHKFNEKERSAKIISLIKEGNKIALVSDAGTPLISDPGGVLLKELYANDIKITSVPGACAVSTFLSLIPRSTEEFAFIGFIPRNKKQQIEILNKYKYTNCVFYDSPKRLLQTLKNIEEEYGSDTKIAIGRELTKVFEEVKINCVSEIISYYENNPLKGEIAAMIFAKDNLNISDDEIIQKIEKLKEEGFSPKDISKIISKLFNENKNKIYKLSLQ